jgi:hypothetical protein
LRDEGNLDIAHFFRSLRARMGPGMSNQENSDSLDKDHRSRRSFNDLLKSNPLLILTITVLISLATTPIVYLYAERQRSSELYERSLRLEEIQNVKDVRLDEYIYKIDRLEKLIDDEESQLQRVLQNVDIAQKAALESSASLTDRYKSLVVEVEDLKKQIEVVKQKESHP